MKRLLRHAAAALTAGALSIGTAHAVLITQWAYTNEAGWSSFTGEGTITPSGNSGSILGLPTTLTWGTNNTSSLVADSPVSGIIFTNGAPQQGVPLTHNNFEIALGISLTSAMLRDALRLQPIVPPGAAFDAPTLEFDISFLETPNAPAGGICADGSPVANGCPDIFVLNNPGELAPVSFIIDDYEYTVTINAVGLGPLSDQACAAVGAGPGCIGFITPENQVSTLMTFFTITARQIPEPGLLGLLGISLGALGFSRRRMK